MYNYFFNETINIENFDSTLLKIKSISIYYIGYITIKNISDHENINSENLTSLIIGEADGYIQEENTN